MPTNSNLWVDNRVRLPREVIQEIGRDGIVNWNAPIGENLEEINMNIARLVGEPSPMAMPIPELGDVVLEENTFKYAYTSPEEKLEKERERFPIECIVSIRSNFYGNTTIGKVVSVTEYLQNLILRVETDNGITEHFASEAKRLSSRNCKDIYVQGI